MKKLIFFMIFELTFFCLSSQNAKEILGDKAEDHNEFFVDGDFKYKLLPQTPLGSQVKDFWKKGCEENPSFVGENLYILKKSNISTGKFEKIDIDVISKVVRSISTLEGIKYIDSWGKEKTLYSKAYSIEGININKKIDDVNTGNANGQISYCMLDDNSFNKMFFTLKYYQYENEIVADFCTTSGIYVGPVKAIEPGNLRICIAIQDLGEEISVYLLAQSKFPRIKLFESKMDKSFRSRLSAIYNWFTTSF